MSLSCGWVDKPFFSGFTVAVKAAAVYIGPAFDDLTASIGSNFFQLRQISEYPERS